MRDYVDGNLYCSLSLPPKVPENNYLTGQGRVAKCSASQFISIILNWMLPWKNPIKENKNYNFFYEVLKLMLY